MKKYLVVFRYSNGKIDAYIDTCESSEVALEIAKALDMGTDNIEIIKEELIADTLKTFKLFR